MRANIAIMLEVNGQSEITTDQKIELEKNKDSYFFSIDGQSQEVQVTKDGLNIVRPEMILNMKLNKTITSIYQNKTQPLELNFHLNKLEEGEDQLMFEYSLMNGEKLKDVIQTLKILIKY